MDGPISMLILSFLLGVSATAYAGTSVSTAVEVDERSMVKVKAPDKITRDEIADLGVAIEGTGSDYVTGVASEKETAILKKRGLLLEATPLAQSIGILDFPNEDAEFRNYNELTTQMQKWVAENPSILKMDSIGKTVEGREIWHMRVSTDQAHADSKPGIVFMGGHHAREHISVEMPLKLIERLVAGYKNGDAEIRRLIETRDIHIIPTVNPDGKDYDVSSGRYRMWRKNRAAVTSSVFGVDLNRNYGFGWGGGGASSDPRSETYRGTSAFSEPETKAIKAFVEKQVNITILLSFHTYSELILYPWGHVDDRIPNDRDYMVHKTMAETMAKWNHYTPQQSSELYIASGDTTDWSYGEHKIISFTFELDPTNMFEGGFYPGAEKIDIVAEKNWRPCLYLMGLADNPYRVLEPTHAKFGLNSALIK